MREVVAVCRSQGKARVSAARVLDRYLWRIGDRTWRGKASNQCLARISADLRKAASRKMAVTLHGFAAGETGAPLFNIGSRRRFNQAGHAPISTSSASSAKVVSAQSPERPVLRIAALFHDLGKSSRLFQAKLLRALAGERGEGQSDPVRHEVISALIWDEITRGVADDGLSKHLQSLKAEHFAQAWTKAAEAAVKLASPSGAEGGRIFPFDFATRNDTVGLIGRLILTHHRLPGLSTTKASFTAGHHITQSPNLKAEHLDRADGQPLWREARWWAVLMQDAARLQPDQINPEAAEFELRTAMILADKHGSACKTEGPVAPFLANTTQNADRRFVPADDLLTHSLRVVHSTRACHEALVRARDLYPAISLDQLPSPLQGTMTEEDPRFAWQGRAAQAAAQAASNGGGFFACLMAGTGSGKTQAAPLILSAAASADPVIARRKLRFTLGLGLRSLATQAGRALVEDIGFAPRDVSIVIGTPPLDFQSDETTGSDEALIGLTGVQIIAPESEVPEVGANTEADWLLGLNYDPDRKVPHALEMLARADRQLGAKLLRLAQAPILCTTIDHIITAASPSRTNHIPGALRLITSDLIIDEVDQFSPEDCAVLARLVWLAGQCGRRVVVLSATVNADLSTELARAYSDGWRLGAPRLGLSPRVNCLFTSDAPSPDACQITADAEYPAEAYKAMQRATLAELKTRPPLRSAETLAIEKLVDVPKAASETISRFHDRHHNVIDGVRVSFGFVRMTRISHVVALAKALPPVSQRLRLIVALHSRMKRATRGWIESELKRALTRKGANPEAGLRKFCTRHNVLTRAKDAGLRDIELVLICSPVMETGNDLDFDYGIIDPGSVRAVVQAAGRINRHRAKLTHSPNVALFSQPLVALETGYLAYPGVETPLSLDTKVQRISLPKDRDIAALYMGADMERLDAAWVLNGTLPLQAKEDVLLRAFLLDTDRGASAWYSSATARLSTSLLTARRFRRTSQRNIELFCDENEFGQEVWFTDDGLSARRNPVRLQKQALYPACPYLFQEPFEQALKSLWPDTEVSSSRLRIASSIAWPQWSEQLEDWSNVLHSEQLGLTRAQHYNLMSD